MAAALCAATLVLGACSDDPPEPKPLDPPSSSTSESPTAPPTSEPPNASTPEQTIREFVRLKTALEKTGDAAEFRAISYNCEFCRSYAARVEKIYERGGFVRTQGWQLRSVRRASALETKPERTYKIVIDNPVTRLKKREGARVETLPAGKAAELLIALVQVDGQWKVHGVSEEQS